MLLNFYDKPEMRGVSSYQERMRLNIKRNIINIFWSISYISQSISMKVSVWYSLMLSRSYQEIFHKGKTSNINSELWILKKNYTHWERSVFCSSQASHLCINSAEQGSNIPIPLERNQWPHLWMSLVPDIRISI